MICLLIEQIIQRCKEIRLVVAFHFLPHCTLTKRGFCHTILLLLLLLLLLLQPTAPSLREEGEKVDVTYCSVRPKKKKKELL